MTCVCRIVSRSLVSGHAAVRTATSVAAMVALLMLGGSASAMAQSTALVAFGGSGGASFPTGRLGDGGKAGYSLAGHLYLRPSALRNLQFRGDVSFDRWDLTGETEGVDEEARVLGFVANALYEFPAANGSRVRPYLIGGVGAYRQKVSATFGSLSADTEETNVGVQVGGGVSFALSGFTTFLEAKYLTAYSSESWSWVPITFGIRF